MTKKKPLILEGEIARSLGRADKLKIPMQSGGNSIWIPEGDVTTKTKSITKNGTYLPKDDDCYGYSKVTVNVPQSSMEGTGPDGNDYLIEPDEDGEHVKITKLPSGIKIVRPPDYRNYSDGDTIKFDGMIVMMTTKKGGLFMDDEHPTGALSLDELDFPVKVAEGGDGGMSSDFDLSPLPNPVSVLTGFVNDYEYTGSGKKYHDHYEFVPSIENVVFLTYGASDTDSLIRPFFASPTGGHLGAVERVRRTYNGAGQMTDEERSSRSVDTNQSYTYGGKTVYYLQGANNSFGSNAYSKIEQMYIIDNTYPSEKKDWLAWTMVYGESSGDTQEIPVEWDTGKYNLKNKPFTDSFKIKVTGSSDSNGFSDYEGGTF